MTNINSVVATIVILLIVVIGGCFGIFNKYIIGNKQIIDLRQTFNTAYINVPGKEVVKVKVDKWNDYDKSDSVQIIDSNGHVYYTHLSNVVLTNE